MSDEIEIDGMMPGRVIEVKFGKCAHHGGLIYTRNIPAFRCKLCDELLSLEFGIERMIHLESEFQKNWLENKLIKQEIEKRQRCKCEHCGRMTNIHVKITDTQIYELMQNERRK